MDCNTGSILSADKNIDFEKELNDNNARVMAIEDKNILDQIGGSLQFGKRQDLFWLVLSVILGSVLILSKLFGGRKTKKR